MFWLHGFDGRFNFCDLFGLGIELRFLLNKGVFFLKEQSLVLLFEIINDLEIGLLTSIFLFLFV